MKANYESQIRAMNEEAKRNSNLDFFAKFLEDEAVDANVRATFFEDVANDILHLSDESINGFCSEWMESAAKSAPEDDRMVAELLMSLKDDEDAWQLMKDKILNEEATKIKATLENAIQNAIHVDEVVDCDTDVAEAVEEAVEEGKDIGEVIETIAETKPPKPHHSLKKFVKTIANAVAGFFKKIGQAMAKFFGNVWKAIKATPGKVKECFSKLFGGISGAWDKLVEGVKKIDSFNKEHPLFSAIILVVTTLAGSFLAGRLAGIAIAALIKHFCLTYLASNIVAVLITLPLFFGIAEFGSWVGGYIDSIWYASAQRREEKKEERRQRREERRHGNRRKVVADADVCE